MSKPVVAIVGRPNVGKSTLFNVLAGEMISIVKDTPGVTRDRIYGDCEWLNQSFYLLTQAVLNQHFRRYFKSNENSGRNCNFNCRRYHSCY